MNSVSAGSRSRGRLARVGAVDVGHEPEAQDAVAVVAQRLVGHRRAEVGAADADVDDVADPACPVKPVHSPRRTWSAKAAIRSRTSWTSGTTSWPSTRSAAPCAGSAERGVEDRAVLGRVDARAGEHRVAALLDAGGLGDREQERAWSRP